MSSGYPNRCYRRASTRCGRAGERIDGSRRCPHGRKRPPMFVTRAEPGQAIPVNLRRISLVLCKLVIGKQAILGHHDPVTSCLRENGCGADCSDRTVATDDRFAFQRTEREVESAEADCRRFARPPAGREDPGSRVSSQAWSRRECSVHRSRHGRPMRWTRPARHPEFPSPAARDPRPPVFSNRRARQVRGRASG